MSAVMKSIEPVNVDKVIEDLLEAKRVECKAKAARIALEEKVIAILGERDEGAKTVELPSGHKVTITAKLDRKLDYDVWQLEVTQRIPPSYHELVKTKEVHEIDLPKLRILQEKEPHMYAIVAKAITTKKMKSSVDVKS